MKKFLVLLCFFTVSFLFLAIPSFSKGATYLEVGYAVGISGDTSFNTKVFCVSEPAWLSPTYGTYEGSYGARFYTGNNRPYYYLYIGVDSSNLVELSSNNTTMAFIPSLNHSETFQNDIYLPNGYTFYTDYDEYIEALPPELRPEDPTFIEILWENYLDWFEDTFGYRPVTYSIYDWLISLISSSDPEDLEITFPTLSPTPTPTPTPTPIPVQTIFVPDGNGNTTIIYQYPDPTTGVITQSPYNPNTTNNITVNCDCDSGSGSGSDTFTSNPQDPYTINSSSLFWADGFGVQMSESPLTVADQQQTLVKDAALEYDSSVAVLSNSFGVLPIKWLALIGTVAAILIFAGVVRTFLGG